MKKNKMYRSSGVKFVLSTLVLSTLLFGCGGDRTVEDYQNDKARGDFEKISAVSGVYIGMAYSKADGQALGILTLTVKPDSKVTPGTNSGDRKAVLNLEFQMETLDRSVNMTFTSAVYDSRATSFAAEEQAEMNVSKSPLSVRAAGTFSGGQVAGELHVAGYSQSGISYQLERGRTMNKKQILSGLTVKASEAHFNDVLSKSYEGYRVSSEAKKESNRMLMNFVRSAFNASQEFVDLLLPVKSVDVGVGIANGAATITFMDAVWDQRNNSIQGETTTTSSGYGFKLSLRCKEILEGWNCLWVSSSGASFHFEVFASESNSGAAQ